MRKQLMVIALIAVICGGIASGCKSQEQTNSSVESTSAEAVECVETQNQEPDKSESKGADSDAQWNKLSSEEQIEINLNAKAELIGDFVMDGNFIYQAATYHGETGGESGFYCYYFSSYYNKLRESTKEFDFPSELEAVSDDMWSNGMPFWEFALGSQNSAFLDSGTLEITVENKEVVELNGISFLREEVYAESSFMGTTPRTTRFVAYYYQSEEGQGVCVRRPFRGTG